MTNPFFLTRQTANLMEDFVRELEQGSALFLLYGESEVGKTRLLQELAQSRLAQRAVYWLDLASADGSEETRMDRSSEIEALFAAAGSGDIVIADHFEMALKKTRHQLLLSWSTDGIDKQLNLVIASSVEGFNELRQLSQQYGVRIQSFQLMPFNSDEVQAFLGFYLFPDQPSAKLSIPSPLRRQIAATRGVVGRLIELADRDGRQIGTEPLAEPESIRQGSRIIGYLLVAVLLAAGLGWYLLPGDPEIEPPPITLNQPADSAPAASAPLEVPPTAVAAEASEATAPVEVPPSGDETEAGETSAEMAALPAADSRIEADVPADGGDVAQIPSAPPVTPSVTEIAAVSAPEEAETTTPKAGLEAPQGDLPAAVAADASGMPANRPIEPGVVPESEAVIVATVDTGAQVPPDAGMPSPAQPGRQRFRDELRRSMDWLRAREDSVGTIQILLLSYENFDPDNYYDYVAGLARREVDVERLRVFKTLTGNREVYSVVYGEYENRRAAQGAIAGLPAVLRDTAPLARSVGGLWQEIRRLETSN